MVTIATQEKTGWKTKYAACRTDSAIYAHQFYGQRLIPRPAFILPRCDAHGALEVSDEMALVVETHRFGDMGQGHALAQQGQRALDAQVDLVGMRRQAELDCKCLHKMEPAQPGNSGNLVTFDSP